jgi:hypothetical protein
MAPSRRCLAFVVVSLCVLLTERANAQSSPANAQNPTLVTLDTTDLEIVARSARKTTAEFTIPARLNVPGVTLRRWSIGQEGRLIDRGATAITLGTPANGTPELVASFDLTKLNGSGRYVATLEFVAPKPPPARPEQGPAAPQPVPGQTVTATPPEPAVLEQTVQLKVNRSAAELRVSSPLRFERTVYLPVISLFGLAWSLEPGAITLSEASGKSWVKADPLQWDVVLRHGEDAPSGMLRVRMPESVDGWGQGQAKVDLEGTVPFGTTSGTLTIRAPQLAAQTVDFPVTLVSRLSALWLLPIIVMGILLGWYFRDQLEARRARLTAILPAEQELTALDDLIASTADPTYRDVLAKIRAPLIVLIDDQTSTTDAIAAATKTAADAREAAVKAMSALRDKLRASLHAWRGPGTENDPLPGEAPAKLKALRDRIGALTSALDSGLLSDVDQGVTDSLPDLARGVRTALAEWLRHLNELKTRPPLPWPETRLSLRLDGIIAEADKLTQELNTSDGSDALWKNLISAAVLFAHCRQDLFGTVVEEAEATAKSVSAAVRSFGPKLEEPAAAIETAAAALPDEAVASGPKVAEAFTDGLNALRATITKGLAAAWNDANQPLPGLEQGNFLAAVPELEKKRLPPEKGMGEGGGPLTMLGDLVPDLASIQEQAAPAVVTRWKIVLEPAAATVSEPVTVRARLVVPLGSDPPDVSLSWFRAGIPAGRSAPGTFERSFTFSEQGAVSIRVTAVDSAGASDSATIDIQVRGVHGARAIASVRTTLASVERIETIFAGAIITVAGWVIFSPSFIGTFPELFAVFLWGFSADVGAAKVRELTESVKGLKVPVPVPKQG